MDYLKRTCKHCKVTKSIDEFRRDHRKPNTIRWDCKECEKNSRKKRHKKSPIRKKLHGINQRHKIKITLEELQSVIDQSEHQCYYCNSWIDITDSRQFQFDHRQPLSKGGTNEIKNIVLSCTKCNQKKNDKTEEEFIQLLRNGVLF